MIQTHKKEEEELQIHNEFLVNNLTYFVLPVRDGTELGSNKIDSIV